MAGWWQAVRAKHEVWAARLDPVRLTLYPGALLVALVVATGLLVATPEATRQEQGLRVGGDWPTFYAAGQVAREQGLAAVYDWDAQKTAQAPFVLPEERDAVIPFSYPPPVAAFLAPLTLLGFTVSYLVTVVAGLGAVAAGVAVLGQRFSRVAAHPALAFVGVAVFPPMARAVFGGQNTPWTFLALAVLMVWPGEAAGAVALALLLLKPQLGLFAALLLLIVGWRGTVVRGGLGVGALLGVQALTDGGQAAAAWLDSLRRFSAADAVADLGHGITTFQLLRPWLGPSDAALAAAGFALVLAAGLAFQRVATRRIVLPVGVAFAPWFLPHLGFYDAGLLALPLLWWTAERGRLVVIPSALVGVALAVPVFADPPLPLAIWTVCTVAGWMLAARESDPVPPVVDAGTGL